MQTNKQTNKQKMKAKFDRHQILGNTAITCFKNWAISLNLIPKKDNAFKTKSIAEPWIQLL